MHFTINNIFTSLVCYLNRRKPNNHILLLKVNENFYSLNVYKFFWRCSVLDHSHWDFRFLIVEDESMRFVKFDSVEQWRGYWNWGRNQNLFLIVSFFSRLKSNKIFSPLVSSSLDSKVAYVHGGMELVGIGTTLA